MKSTATSIALFDVDIYNRNCMFIVVTTGSFPITGSGRHFKLHLVHTNTMQPLGMYYNTEGFVLYQCF